MITVKIFFDGNSTTELSGLTKQGCVWLKERLFKKKTFMAQFGNGKECLINPDKIAYVTFEDNANA